jgi:hypothetical protein
MAGQDQNEQLKQMIAKLKAAGKNTTDLEGHLQSLKKPIQGAKNAVDNLSSALETAESAGSGLFNTLSGANWDLSIQGVISFANEMSTLTSEMNKATGAAGKLGPAMANQRDVIGGLAARYSDLTQNMTAVFNNMTDFSKLAPTVQGQIAGMAFQLSKLGIGAEETAKNLDIMTKSMGLSADQAMKTQMDIAKTARSLGVAPKKLSADFAAAAPKLTQYGNKAFEVFKKLAGQAKATGMEMNKLLDITAQFDTFEGAAEATAKLNAVMGTQLNSVDLLMASEADRITMLKEGVNATGKSWEAMGRWEKKALAAAATSGDMEAAARMFGTSMEDMADAEAAADPGLVSQQELTKAIQAGVSRAEAFEAMLEGIQSRLAKGIMPLVDMFFGWFNSKALPRVLEYLDHFTNVTLPNFQARWSKFYADNRVFMEEFLPKIVGIVLALGPIISILKGISAGIALIGTLIGSSIAPVLLMVGAVYLLYTRFESVRTVVHSVWNNVVKPFMAGFIEGFLFVGEVFGNVFRGLWAQFSQVWTDITSFFGTGTGDMATSAKNFGLFVGVVFGEIAQVIGLVVGGMVRIFRSSFGLIAGVVKGVARLLRGDVGGAITQFGDTLLKAMLTPLNLFLGGLSSALDLIGIGSDTLNQWRNKAGDMDIGGLNAKREAALGLDTAESTKFKAKQRSIETNLQANSVAPSGPLLSSMAVSMPSLSTRGASANAGSTTAITGTSAGGTTLTINIDGRQFVKDIVVPQLNKVYAGRFKGTG